jgi:hypothetical protein
LKARVGVVGGLGVRVRVGVRDVSKVKDDLPDIDVILPMDRYRK